MASDIPALLGIDDFTTPLMLAYKKLDTSPVVISAKFKHGHWTLRRADHEQVI